MEFGIELRMELGIEVRVEFSLGWRRDGLEMKSVTRIELRLRWGEHQSAELQLG